MVRKWIKWIITAAIILMMIVPSLGAITKSEAEQVVLPYVKTEETVKMAGPYTYENHAYYYAEITISKTLNGVLIIDAESGNVVTDREIAKKISYTNAYFENVTPENLAAYNISKEIYVAAAASCRQTAEMFKLEIPLYKADDREKLGTIVQSYQEIAGLFDELANIYGQNSATQADIISGNTSYENAVKLTNQIKEMENTFRKLDGSYDKVMADTNTYFDVLINGAAEYNLNATLYADLKLVSSTTWTQEKEIIVTQQIALIEEDKTNTEKRVETDMQLMDARLNAAPGFGILLAVCAVLIGGILIQKRRK